MINPRDTHTKPPLCCHRIKYTNGKKGDRGCIRRGVVLEGVLYYCKQHAPVSVAKREKDKRHKLAVEMAKDRIVEAARLWRTRFGLLLNAEGVKASNEARQELRDSLLALDELEAEDV